MQSTQILSHLKFLSSPKILTSMTRFGAQGKNMYGVSIPDLRKLAKNLKSENRRAASLAVSKSKNHALALQLWESGIHEARILASMIDEPTLVTAKQMDQWVKVFDSWDICDQVCANLFRHTDFGYKKAFEWCQKQEEFIKRAGFAMMAYLAVSDKKADDKAFTQFFPFIKKESTDERNFVKKAVNWALRQIGKRNKTLCQKAITLATEIQKIDSKSAKWIAGDALRELKEKFRPS